MAKIKAEVEEAITLIKVELLDAKAGATNAIYHKLGVTNFNDGIAEVTADVEAELRKAGLLK